MQCAGTISVQSTPAGWRNYGGTLTLNLFEVNNTGNPAFGGYLGAGTLLQSWTGTSGQPAAVAQGGGSQLDHIRSECRQPRATG